MADLYSNRELAVVREYSTNAYDSNKEKALRDGTDIEPIQVTLPNAMNPYFTVQDYGMGMSERELKEVYTQFGESSKRDSDEFNGMLGFGSKSAVAYTNTFTVTAVQDGRKTVGVITRREDAMGGYLLTLKIVLTVDTTERDGVLIQVPVHNWREFEQKAQDFYRFWLPGTVLVNGKEPKWAVGDKIDDNLYYYETQYGYNSESYVVMGNVPYRIANPDALFPRGMNKISFVAYVPLGAVEFTPSREDLKYSDHTKNNLGKIITDFVAKSVETAKKEIGAATTHYDAYNMWTKWRRIIGSGQVDDLTFKGEQLVDSFKIEADRWDTQSYRYSTWTIHDWQVGSMSNTLIVTKFDVKSLAASHKKKVKDWLNFKNMRSQYVLFTDADKIDSVWVDPSRVVEWETVKAEAPKPPKKVRQPSIAWGRRAGSFDLVSAKDGRKTEQDVPSTKPLYYIMVKEYNAQEDRGAFITVLKQFNIDESVVLMPANRLDKFLRFYPYAQNILPVLQAKVTLDGPSLLTPDGVTYTKTDHSERAILAAMDPALIDDPELAKLVKVFAGKTEEDYLGEYRKHYRLAVMLGLAEKFKRHQYENYWDARDFPLTKNYPLANAFNHRNNKASRNINEHVYTYINAVYAARKDGKNV
jgi:hypothetical protein